MKKRTHEDKTVADSTEPEPIKTSPQTKRVRLGEGMELRRQITPPAAVLHEAVGLDFTSPARGSEHLLRPTDKETNNAFAAFDPVRFDPPKQLLLISVTDCFL